jgi:hypothetical protein
VGAPISARDEKAGSYLSRTRKTQNLSDLWLARNLADQHMKRRNEKIEHGKADEKDKFYVQASFEEILMRGKSE